MEENGGTPKKTDKNFVAFIAIGAAVASIISGFCLLAYVGLILGIAAIAISVIFLVKKMGIKWFGFGALLLGVVGVFLGAPMTYERMAAQFGWGGETIVETVDEEQLKNAAEIEDSLIERQSCLEEAGIDIDAYYDDLADEQKDAYDLCFE